MAPDSEVLRAIGALKQQRMHAATSGHYRDAAAGEECIEQLKQEEDQRLQQALLAKQAEAADEVEAQFQEDYGRFAEGWDAHMGQLQHEARRQLAALQEAQGGAAEALEVAQASARLLYKWSSRVLDMRSIERTLAGQKAFAKAQEVKRQADRLEAQEAAAQEAELLAKVQLEAGQAAGQQRREQEALRKRLGAVQAEALQRQQAELQRLIRRYQAAQLALERAQAAQRLQHEAHVRGKLGIARHMAQPQRDAIGTSLA